MVMRMRMMMKVSLSALLQSCLMMMMVRCGQLHLRDSGDCETHTRQSDLNSFLWTIKREPPSFFYGTIHVPYTRVWDFIPENSKQAFQRSGVVFFELDLTDPSTVSGLSSCQLLPPGEILQDLIPDQLYRRLKAHLEYVRLMLPSWVTPGQRGQGLYAEYLFNAIAGNWERKRPVWVMLMVNALTEAEVKSRGVPVLDLYLAQEAQRMRKRTGAVEEVEEQCLPLNGLSFQQVIFALNQTLLQQESLRAGSLQVPYTTEDLIKHYNCGDLNSIIFNHDSSQVPNFRNVSLPASDQETAQEIDRYFRQELIYKRNERMGRRVKALLQEQPDRSFFFAFGAGHFLGNNTVIDVLRREGYEVEHVPAGQPLPRSGWRPGEPEPEPFLHESLQEHEELLLAERMELTETAEHKLKKKRRNKQRKQSRRQFNDLWVRLEDSVTAEAPPPLVRIINGYISVQTHPQEYGRANHDGTFSGSSPSWTSPALSALSVQMIIRLLL
ncbi:metalloprotease TIKI1 [Pimephales promelas]|uniref:metalloprotease TIKI1 n=1 Tax=Pimephales promelas TaxID=90988 RepID=UPI0019556FA0|nr:metalloprotease TIKI1 [Pimephales promelas]KAG1931715.1 metalloprotease TIKI2 [Pimephales promelas]